MRAPSFIFGVPIDDLTMPETLDAIDALVADGRRTGATHQVATVNVDFLANALTDPKIHDLLQSTSLNLADGLPLVWASRLAGIPVAERVAGSDLVPLIAAEAARRGWRVHFFGSAPGIAEQAIAKMHRTEPRSQLSGESGPMMADVRVVDDSVLDDIASLAPDILCVALGNPKQERFIAAHRDRLGTPVMIGIGGSLDMYVGAKRRAPKWMQKVGLEWVFRAAQEPRRLGKRYGRDIIVFVPRFGTYLRRLRRFRHGAALQPIRVDASTVSFSLTEDRDAEPVPLDSAMSLLSSGAAFTVDYRGLDPRPAAIGELLALLRTARLSGCTITVQNVSDETTRRLVHDLALPGWMVTGVADSSAR